MTDAEAIAWARRLIALAESMDARAVRLAASAAGPKPDCERAYARGQAEAYWVCAAAVRNIRPPSEPA